MTGLFGPETPIVGLVTTNSPDYFRRFHELVSAGTVVVPLRGADDRARIEACGIAEIVAPEAGHGWLDVSGSLPDDDRVALVTFTSGTQGEPKGVVLTRGNLANTIARLQEVMRVDSLLREYVGVPIQHAFGNARCRLAAAVGGAAYVPPKGFDPRELAAMLAAGEVNAVSAVATLLRTLLHHAELIRPHAERVRWIEFGSQPMAPEEKAALRRLFPAARIVEHFGLTEASKSTFLVVSEAPYEELDTVGRATGDVEIQIGASGRIRIRGGHVARELVVGGRRVPNVDAEGWFDTGDVGRMKGENLCFLGRADDVINSGGVKISSDRLQAGVAERLGIGAELCVARIPDAARGDGVLLAVRESCARPDPEIVDAAVAVLAEAGIRAASSVRLMRVPDFPRTASGKIRRVQLVEEYLASAAAPPPPGPAEEAAGGTLLGRLLAPVRALLGDAQASGAPRSVRALFARAYPARQIRDGDSFVSLGGDSLGFVELSISLERVLGQLPEGWEEMSVRELEAIVPRESVLKPVDTTLLLRFVGILAVVALHFTPVALGGATFLLLVVAGYNFSRFQLRNVLATDRAVPILGSAFRIGLPLFLLSAAIQLRQGHIQPENLLFLGNYEPAAGQGFDYWFVEVLIQLLLILAALLAVPAVRRAARTRPLAFALGLLAVSALLAKIGPALWDTSALYDRVPHMVLWMFALGWALHQATTLAAKLLTGGLALLLPLALWGVSDPPFWVGYGPVWILAGSALLLWTETVPVPRPVNRLAYWIGGASMFIYITHWSTRGIWHRVAPVQSDWLDVAVAILVGVLAWLAWEAAMRLAGQLARTRRLAY